MAFDPRLVVFDVAGTTVKDTGHIPEAFAAAFRAHGLLITDQQIAGVRGASKREAIEQLLPASPQHQQRSEAVYATFRQELARAYASGGIHAVDGADGIFKMLRARGVKVALNTGLDRDIVALLLSTLRWSVGVVDAVVCGADVRHGRPAPDLIVRAMALTGVDDPGRVANVGDTVMDLRAGHAAGVRWNIGVCSGAHDREQLAAEPHTHLLRSIADLSRVE